MLRDQRALIAVVVAAHLAGGLGLVLREPLAACRQSAAGCFLLPADCDISAGGGAGCEAGVVYATKGDGKAALTLFTKQTDEPLYYVAFGVSNDNRMGDDTVVECVFGRPGASAHLSWNEVDYTGRRTKRLSAQATANNLGNKTEFAVEDGYAACELSVPLLPLIADGSAERMLPLLGDYYLMLATGPAGSAGVRQHTARSVSPIKVDVAKHRGQLLSTSVSEATRPPAVFPLPSPPTPPHVEFPGGTVVAGSGFLDLAGCQSRACHPATGACAACMTQPAGCVMDSRLPAGRRCEAAVKIDSNPKKGEDFVLITLVKRIDESLSEQYAAVAFSADHKMGNDAVTECVYTKGAVADFKPYLSYNRGRENERLPSAVTAAHLKWGVSWSIADGYMVCTVKQTLESADERVFDLDEEHTLLLATGPASNGELRVHAASESDPLFPVGSESKLTPYGAQGTVKMAKPSSGSSSSSSHSSSSSSSSSEEDSDETGAAGTAMVARGLAIVMSVAAMLY